MKVEKALGDSYMNNRDTYGYQKGFVPAYRETCENL